MIPLPYQLLGGMLLLIGAYALGRVQGTHTAEAQCESARVASVQQATEAVLLQVQSARLAEKDAQDRLAAAEMTTLQETRRAEALEADVAAAVLRGQRRVRASICSASRAVLPGNAAARGQPDAGADDGSRRIGRAVGAAAACDAQIRGLQAYARACEALTKGK